MPALWKWRLLVFYVARSPKFFEGRLWHLYRPAAGFSPAAPEASELTLSLGAHVAIFAIPCVTRRYR